MSEHREKLPLELLMEKYIPVSEFPKRYNVSVSKVMKLIESGKVRKAEFRIEGERRRTAHANYEEVLKAIEKEKEDELNT